MNMAYLHSHFTEEEITILQNNVLFLEQKEGQFDWQSEWIDILLKLTLGILLKIILPH